LNFDFREGGFKPDLSAFVGKFRHEKKDVCCRRVRSEKVVILAQETTGRDEGFHGFRSEIAAASSRNRFTSASWHPTSCLRSSAAWS
jgi:hypothetical protein